LAAENLLLAVLTNFFTRIIPGIGGILIFIPQIAFLIYVYFHSRRVAI
jgi:predicted PurR-regulated permease PerM